MFAVLWSTVADVSPANHPLSGEQFADLLEAIRSADSSSGWMSEGSKALASLIGAVASLAWPVAIFAAVWTFRPQVRQLLGRVKEGEAFGIKFKIENELAASAQEAQVQDTGPTAGEIRRAGEVAELATQTDSATILEQVSRLAAEYEHVRASLPSGSERTRLMNGVAAKMRTIGVAAFRFRYDLSVSPSPGKRLQAIASLQVATDFDLTDWLTDKVMTETPFVSFHALIAIYSASQSAYARDQLWRFDAVLRRLDTPPPGLDKDPPRVEMLRRLRERVNALKGSPISP
ncbi:MAG: hypothetical protein ACLQJL_01285 [Roseiarcus sp.]